MITAKMNKTLFLLTLILLVTQAAWAEAEEKLAVTKSELAPEQITLSGQPALAAEQAEVAALQLAEELPSLEFAEAVAKGGYVDALKYTLGPDDVVDITVMRHPEFSGKYPIDLEGKIQYKFVGDIVVRGLTKAQLENKIRELVSVYVINPEVNVTILEYKSKVIYVIGEVGHPGKYFMRSESIPVREAVVQAGLPTLSAAMRRSRLITPAAQGKVKTKNIDLYSILYGGELKHNLDMKPGDVLYVPATVMAKIIRVINPVTAAVGVAASAPSEVGSARQAVNYAK